MTQAAVESTGKHKVVIIGSGFGGLFSARALADSDVDITLIAKTSHHLFQPLLYQVATGVLSTGEIAPSTREILKRQENARVILGDVVDIDLDHKLVTSEIYERITVTPYDTLILSAGAGQSYFGNDQFADFAPGMKTIDDALELRARIFQSFELAELSDDPDEIAKLLTFVVVGAGPTGVEMAGQIAELAHRALRLNFRHVDPAGARVVLLDAAPMILPVFGEKLAGKARKTLESLGVEVRTSAAVTLVDADGITIKEKDGTEDRIEAVCKIWAAGVQASPLGALVAHQAGVEVDRAGRVPVEPNLTLAGHPEVFVIGDMMSLNRLPGVAQVAIQGGKYAAKLIDARLQGKPEGGPFKYFDKGSMATVSRYSAIAMVGKLRMSGFIAWLMWLVVHLAYITGFKNRFTTVIHWTVSFLGRGRSERTATQQQAIAREALELLGQSWLSVRKDAKPIWGASAPDAKTEPAAEAIPSEPLDAGSGSEK